MNNPTPTDATPHELLNAEISVTGLEGPANELALSEALKRLEGVRTLGISGGKISLEYEPVRITKAQIGEVLARAGYNVAEIESTPTAPISDALHGS